MTKKRLQKLSEKQADVFVVSASQEEFLQQAKGKKKTQKKKSTFTSIKKDEFNITFTKHTDKPLFRQALPILSQVAVKNKNFKQTKLPNKDLEQILSQPTVEELEQAFKDCDDVKQVPVDNLIAELKCFGMSVKGKAKGII